VGVERDLEWQGCFNVRDLGGLPTTSSRMTRWGAVVRSDAPERLTHAGWEALEAYGVRTIIDLRNDEEREIDDPVPSLDIKTVHLPLDDISDHAFWGDWKNGPQFGTPLYFQPFLERKPERCASVVGAVARAKPGGVVVHCGGGRDRTGLIAMLLLALVGVPWDDIAVDYERSYERMQNLFAALGEEDQRPVIEDYLAQQNTTAHVVILQILASIDVEACLRTGGLGDDDLAAVRQRLLG
jgi:protein tyrosine/serine phosphatase